MKAAEILRKLADMIDQHSDQGEQARPENSVQHAELAPVEVDNSDETELSTMLPPLQAKLEILKKATGIDSHFDDEETEEVPDELARIKQNAGIHPVVVHIAGEDNDIVG
jgi:hypothetical protein